MELLSSQEINLERPYFYAPVFQQFQYLRYLFFFMNNSLKRIHVKMKIIQELEFALIFDTLHCGTTSPFNQSHVKSAPIV